MLDRGEEVGLDVGVVVQVHVLDVEGHGAVTGFLTVVECDRLALEVAALSHLGGQYGNAEFFDFAGHSQNLFFLVAKSSLNLQSQLSAVPYQNHPFVLESLSCYVNLPFISFIETFEYLCRLLELQIIFQNAVLVIVN